MTDPCEACGDPVGTDGCRHDGHLLCASDLVLCPECLASMSDDFYPDRTYR